jgi:large subunit ribosomal protein L3
MSEETVNTTVESNEAAGGLKTSSIFAFKEGMSSYVDDKGDMIAVTVLRYEPWVVSQVKTKETDGYNAVQIASGPKKAVRASSSSRGHFKAAGFENGAQFARELKNIDGAKVGQKLDIQSIAAGDEVKVTARSKGKGFAGAVKRWGNAGGPATHGSGFHRAPGSSGNRTWPGRVMPGKHFPGHLGDETVTVKSQVIEVLPEDNVVILRGSIPGAKKALVQITKV